MLNTESFIEKARAVHGNKYDYSKVDYVNVSTKVCIICSMHGEFYQTPSKHLSGQGCRKCRFPVFDTQSFVEKAREVHGDKYDYSKVEYTNSQTKVCIICPEHGEFWQTPNSHLTGYACYHCGRENSWNTRGRITSQDFIKKACEIHGDKYDYSKVNYKGNNKKICIICPEHGEFWQEPSSHLQGSGCPKCKGGVKDTHVDFIKKACEIHGDKYDYSKVEYTNSQTKVCIICPEHGEFWQTPSSHLQGSGCPKCGNERIRKYRLLTTEKFIEKARKIHGDRYDYSKVEYVNIHTKVCIICPEHGEFWQEPNLHVNNKSKCPSCYYSKLELMVEKFLASKSFKFIREYSPEWLGRMRIDFYLPDYNIAIECQGEQHFQKNYRKQTLKSWENKLERDSKKNKKCVENNVRLLYFVNEKNKSFYNIINNSEYDFMYQIKNTITNLEDLNNLILN